eukprot:TRINITY_DN4005_c0_g1_i7.p1 TRINITY_DN4005_c0_g1~~TRINITY_DN4005_c0_g1_i7.p1  ORF type:complete len:285 (+),score=43.45 TRINITY_DN4005_c0_g1_i7:61-855(+)
MCIRDSLYIDPVKDDASFILFGAYDPEFISENLFSNLPISDLTFRQGLKVEGESFSIGDLEVMSSINYSVYFDPTNSYIVISRGLYQEIERYKKDEGKDSVFLSPENLVMYRFDRMLQLRAELSILMSGRYFALDPLDYIASCVSELSDVICLTRLKVSDQVLDTDIILGSVFLKKYTIYVDYEESTIGVVRSVGPNFRFLSFIKAISALLFLLLVASRLTFMINTHVLIHAYRRSQFLKDNAASMQFVVLIAIIVPFTSIFPL